MTLEQLDKQLEQALADERARADAARKRIPEPMRYGRDGNVIPAAVQCGTATYGKLERNRLWGFNEEGKVELGAYAVAALGLRVNLHDFFDAFATEVHQHNLQARVENQTAEREGRGERWQELPEWIKEMPQLDAGIISPLPVDPVTGERARNPFLPLPPRPGETEPHFDHESQNAIKQADAPLARWLQLCAQNGGLPSVAMLRDLEIEKSRADELRKAVEAYDERSWSENKLRKDIGATATEVGQFTKSLSTVGERGQLIDTPLLQVHRREATQGSPRGHLSNLTLRMKLSKRDPRFAEVHKRAEEILSEWKTAEREKAA